MIRNIRITALLKSLINAVKLNEIPANKFSSSQALHKVANKQIKNNSRTALTYPQSDTEFLEDDDDPDYEGETDPFMKTEIKKYNIGKRWLAKMMGEDPETFTQEDIDEAIKYLLPSPLFSKDARPMMKHPYDIFPRHKETEFDKDGRPKASAYFTGKPSYYDLTYQIWNILEQFQNNETSIIISDFTPKETSSNKNKDVQLMQWMKQFQIEEKLGEKLNEKLYDTIIYRLKKIANHSRANEVQEFLSQFQIPLYTPGKEDLKDVQLADNAARSMGYRKTAIAEVIVREGSGRIEINNVPLIRYFRFHNDREQIMYPLLLIDELERFDIEAHVIGGGISGRAGALRLGMCRAIASLCPEHFDTLNKAGLLIKDNRIRERKKPGRRGARRSYQWSKR